MDSTIVTIPNVDNSRLTSFMTFKGLHNAKFTFNSPFRLQFEDGEIFVAEEIIRLLPKKRLVAFGTWQNRPVVAKIFFDANHSKKHYEKELAGIHLLTDCKIPTPLLYYQGVNRERQIYILIFERLLTARNLETILQNDKNDHHLPLLQSAVIELATQHVMGLKQRDLHLKNFLLTENKWSEETFYKIYTLDGAQIEKFPTILPKHLSKEHLALFLSQLGVGRKEQQKQLFEHYAKARGWLIKQDDIYELYLLIKRWNKERWKKYCKKIFRDCTDFSSIHASQVEGMFARQYGQNEFLKFLQNPEIAFQKENKTLLKSGRSATVVKIELDGKHFVVKRYNIKNVWHGMRRYLKTPRARKSWRLGLKLSLFGVTTAKPIAYLETKCFGLNKQAYYVTDYVQGEHVGQYFKQDHLSEENINAVVRRIIHLLKNLARMGLSHGDLKMTNILIDESLTPHLIDLDGMCEHTSLSSLHRAWKKDWQRFLRNFQANPDLSKRFQEEWRKK